MKVEGLRENQERKVEGNIKRCEISETEWEMNGRKFSREEIERKAERKQECTLDPKLSKERLSYQDALLSNLTTSSFGVVLSSFQELNGDESSSKEKKVQSKEKVEKSPIQVEPNEV